MSGITKPGLRRVGAVSDAIVRGCDALLALQDTAGWWKGELETNVTMDAEDLFFREFLAIREPGPSKRQAAWIRSKQRSDGTQVSPPVKLTTTSTPPS